MPIYEYSCPQCGTEFEKLVQPGAAVSCPGCQSGHVVRRLSLIGVRSGKRPGEITASGGGCCAGGCACR